MPSVKVPKYRLKWPLTPTELINIDQMLTEIYSELSRLSAATPTGVLGPSRADLGGMDTLGRVTTSWMPVVGARVQSFTASELAGVVTAAVLFSRTDDASTSVQLRLHNLTDNTDAVVGAVSTFTSTASATLDVTLVAGKDYELQIVGGDLNNAVFGWGFLRFRPV